MQRQRQIFSQVSVVFSIIFSLLVYCIAGQAGESAANNDPESSASDAQSCAALVVMDNARLESLIARIDPDFRGSNGHWQLSVGDNVATVITDEGANRMRIVVPVGATQNLDADLLYRMMQANFDTALDARYAIANQTIFSTFIHPLQELADTQFASGVAQSIALAASFGETYSSGAVTFRGGDSAATERELYERIIEEFRALGDSI